MKPEEIDKKIGMPDIEKEWTRFEREVIDMPQLRPQQPRWIRRVAAVVLVGILSGIALAATFYLRHASGPSPEDAVSSREEAVVMEAEVASGHDDLTTYYDDQNKTLVFDDVELQTIALCLAHKYGVEPVFVNEESRHVRFYVSIPADKGIEEIVSLLNNFQHVQMRLEDGQLIIQ